MSIGSEGALEFFHRGFVDYGLRQHVVDAHGAENRMHEVITVPVCFLELSCVAAIVVTG